MKEYFEAEMRHLHETAQQFAKHHPGLATRLNLQAINDRDPYIERLLEGMAFLTGQIKQKIDDDLPEIYESLLAQMWPQILRPMPSCTILKFQPEMRRLQKTYEIPAETVVMSQRVGTENTICRFRTTVPLKLNPISIVMARLITSKSGEVILHLQFQSDAGIELKKLDLSELKLYLHADSTLVLRLYYLLTSMVKSISISFPEFIQMPEQYLNGQDCIIPCHLKSQEDLLPHSDRSFSGFQQLLDYFCFREKYFFVGLLGLNRIHWPDRCYQFDMAIHLKSSCYLEMEKFQKEYCLSLNNFQLHCVSAVNLFKTHCEPIRLTHYQSEYPLIADVNKSQSIQIYSVDKVVGKTENGDHYCYGEMHNYHHWTLALRYYYIHQCWLTKQYPNYYLAIGGTSDLSFQSLSIDATATNGDYPRRYLGENFVDQQSFSLNHLCTVQNIIRPSSLYYPPTYQHLHWILLAQMSLNISCISELQQFKKLLHCFNWNKKQENERQIAGIETLMVKPIQEIHHGALMQGLEFHLQCHEENYRSTADIYLFGTILHQFFRQYVAINYFVTTKINCYPSNKELQWKMEQGTSIPT